MFYQYMKYIISSEGYSIIQNIRPYTIPCACLCAYPCVCPLETELGNVNILAGIQDRRLKSVKILLTNEYSVYN